jgi:DNA modification methylase
MKPLILTPGFGDNAPNATLYYGQDVRKSLRILPEASVHTVCTSPPYWGLRNYGDEKEQVGIEGSPQEFAEALVEVFREIKRVLRPDGTVWLNLGDSYCGTGHKGDHTDPKHKEGRNGQKVALNNKIKGLKSKDLVGIPWRVAFALQADGWYLRSDIIWAKGNPMPESVKDRPTKAHEYIFLFAHPDSGGKYHYDHDAIKERCSRATIEDIKARKTFDNKGSGEGTYEATRPDLCRSRDAYVPADLMRNKRTVWGLNTKSYRGAHFATWPPALVEPMILAGCPTGGTVLDPFSGSATTGMVALQEGRNYIGIDLHEDYLDLAKARIEGRKAPQEPTLEGSGVDIFELFGGGV